MLTELRIFTTDRYEEDAKLLKENNWQQRVYQDLQKAGINLDDVKRVINESVNSYLEELKETPKVKVGAI